MEVRNEGLSDVASMYRNLTGGMKLNENETMSDYILRQASYSLFLLT